MDLSAIWSKINSFSDKQRCQRLQACQDITKCVQNCLQRQRAALSLLDSSAAAAAAADDGNGNTTIMVKKQQQQQEEQPIELLDIEHCVAGIRMMKYFQWRESEAHNYPLSSTKVAVADATAATTAVGIGIPTTTTTTGALVVDKEEHADESIHDNNNINNNININPPQQQLEIPTCAREIHAQWACRAVSLACSPHLIRLRECFDEIGKQEVLSVPYFGYATSTSTTTTSTSTSDNTIHNVQQHDNYNATKRIPCRELQASLGKCVAERAAELEQRVSSLSSASSNDHHRDSTVQVVVVEKQ